jgi:hypothetical protein
MKTFEFGSSAGKHLIDFGIKPRIGKHDKNELFATGEAVHIVLANDLVYDDGRSSTNLDLIAELTGLILRAQNLALPRIHVHFEPPRIIRNEVRILLNAALSQALLHVAHLKHVHIHWSMLSPGHNPLQYGVLVDPALIVYHPE